MNLIPTDVSTDPIDEFEESTTLQGERPRVKSAAKGQLLQGNGLIDAANPAPSANGRKSAGRLNGTQLNGSPLPTGSGNGSAKSVGRGIPLRSLASAADEEAQQAPQEEEMSAGNKTLNALKQVLPVMQKLLPLIDGNVLGVVSNLLAPARPHTPPQPKLDLAPLHAHMAEIQQVHEDLHGQIAEHNSSLKRVEDQLEMVKEATDRNTLEQQELIEDLRVIGNKVNLFAAMLFGLLILSLILNLVLFMHIKQVLP